MIFSIVIYSIILISSYLLVNKLRIPLYTYFKMPTPNTMNWQVPSFIFLLQVFLLISYFSNDASSILFAISCIIVGFYSVWIITSRKLYIGCDIGLIVSLVLCLNLAVYNLPISESFDYEIWFNTLSRAYLFPILSFVSTVSFLGLIYTALHNDKDFLIRLWNGN